MTIAAKKKKNIHVDVFTSGREHQPVIPILQAEKTLADHWRGIIFSCSQEVVILAELALQKLYWIFVKT